MSASTLVDLVKIQAQSTGSGPITLGPPVPGWRGVAALTDGRTYSYSIQQDGNYEAGTGVYLAIGNLFVRTPRLSSNGGAPISLATGAVVVFTALAIDYGKTTNEGVTFEELAQASTAGLIGAQLGLTIQDTLDRGVRNLSCLPTGPYAYDDIDSVDQLLNGSLTPGGKEYQTEGAGALTVAKSGGMIFDPNALNWYAHIRNTAQFEAATLTFMFVPTGIANPTYPGSRGCGFMAQDDAATLANIFPHCTIQMDGFAVDARVAGTWDFTIIQGGYSLEPLVQYQFHFERTGPTEVTVTSPFGQKYVGTSANVDDFIASTMSLQIFDDGTTDTYAYEGRILGWSLGQRVTTNRALALGSAPNELGSWRGNAFDQRKFGIPSGFIASANSAYRICWQQVFAGGFGNIGIVEISAQQANGNFLHGMVSVTCSTIGAPRIEPFGPMRIQGTPISEIRASHNGSTLSGIDLIFPSAASSPVTVHWRTIGYFTNIASPQSGATALGATASYFPVVPPVNRVIATVNTEGLHTLATEAAFAGFGMATRCWLRATSDIADTLVEITAAGLPGGSLVIGYGLCANNVGFTVTSATISRLLSGSVRLDVYVNSLAPTYPVTLTALFAENTVFTPGDLAYHAAPLADGNKTTGAFTVTSGRTLTDPTGGATVDTQARTADTALNALLKSGGFAN